MNKEKSSNSSGSEDLQVIPNYVAIRQRLKQYTEGITNQERWQWLVHEVTKCAAIAERCNRASQVIVTLHKGKVVSIEDDGRGLPIHPSTTGINVVEDISRHELDIIRPNLEFILTNTFAGTSSEAVYEKTGFLLGIGPVLVGVTQSLMITTWYGNRIYSIAFEEGKLVEFLKSHGNTERHGTVLTFKPSTHVFGDVETDYNQLALRCDELRALTKVCVDCDDQR